MDGIIQQGLMQASAYPYLFGFGLIWVRLNTVFWLTPLWGGQRLPLSIRSILSLILSACILLHLNADQVMYSHAVDEISGLIRLALAVFQEIMVGVLLSYTVLIILQVFMMVGEWIGSHAGLGFSALVDPSTGNQVPALGQVYHVMTVWVLISLNAHLSLIHWLLHSFKIFPLNKSWSLSQSTYGSWIEFSAILFRYALNIALPIMISLILVNLALGLISKSAPQFNLFSIGFAVSLCVAFGLLILCLGRYPEQIQDMFTQATGFYFSLK